MAELYDSAVEEKQDEIKNSSTDDNYKIATVTSLFEDGCPKLTFVGEETESSKKYSYIYTYIPSVNDIVLLVKANNTYVIIGKIAYNVAPNEVPYTNAEIDSNIETVVTDKISTQETETQKTVDTKISNSKTSILNTVSKNLTTALADYLKLSNGTIQLSEDINSSYIRNFRTSEFQHTGSYLGFFNHSLASKTGVNTLSSPSTATTSTIATHLNTLINALKSYGLV